MTAEEGVAAAAIVAAVTVRVAAAADVEVVKEVEDAAGVAAMDPRAGDEVVVAVEAGAIEATTVASLEGAAAAAAAAPSLLLEVPAKPPRKGTSYLLGKLSSQPSMPVVLY